MAVVAFEELHAVHDPGIEAGTYVLEDFTHEVPAIAQPGQFRSRRCEPDGFFTLFALITDVHAGGYLRAVLRRSATSFGMSDGRSATGAPIASNAFTLLSGVPVLPEMIAPA
jgi:hypothetical protein